MMNLLLLFGTNVIELKATVNHKRMRAELLKRQLQCYVMLNLEDVQEEIIYYLSPRFLSFHLFTEITLHLES